MSKSAPRQDWATPRRLFDRLNAEYAFTIDAAALATNARLPRFITPEQDGLVVSWVGERVWCNPPYNATSAWVAKGAQDARGANTLVVMLIPADTSTKWYHEVARSNEVHFFKGRVGYEAPIGYTGRVTSPFFPSMLLVMPKPHRIIYRDSKTGKYI